MSPEDIAHAALERFNTSVPSLNSPGCFGGVALTSQDVKPSSSTESKSSSFGTVPLQPDVHSGMPPSVPGMALPGFSLRRSLHDLSQRSPRREEGKRETEKGWSSSGDSTMVDMVALGSIGGDFLVGRQSSGTLFSPCSTRTVSPRSSDLGLSDSSSGGESSMHSFMGGSLRSSYPLSWDAEVALDHEVGKGSPRATEVKHLPIAEHTKESSGAQKLDALLSVLREAILAHSSIAGVSPAAAEHISLQEYSLSGYDCDVLHSEAVVLKEMRDLVQLARCQGLYVPCRLGSAMLEQCILRGNEAQHESLLCSILERTRVASLFGNHVHSQVDAFGIESLTNCLAASVRKCFEFFCDNSSFHSEAGELVCPDTDLTCASPLVTALSSREYVWALRPLLAKIGSRNPVLYSSTCCFSQNEYLASAAITGGTLDLMLELCPGVLVCTLVEDRSFVDHLPLHILIDLWDCIVGLYDHFNPQRHCRREAVASFLQKALLRTLQAAAVGKDQSFDEEQAPEVRRALVGRFLTYLPSWHDFSISAEEARELLIACISFARVDVIVEIMKECSIVDSALREPSHKASLLLCSLRREDRDISAVVLQSCSPTDLLERGEEDLAPVEALVSLGPQMRRWALEILSGQDKSFPLTSGQLQYVRGSLDKFEDLIRSCAENGADDALVDTFAFTKRMRMTNFSPRVIEALVGPAHMSPRMVRTLLENITLQCFLNGQQNLLERLLDSGRLERFVLFLKAHPQYLEHTEANFVTLVTRQPHTSAFLKRCLSVLKPELLLAPTDTGTTLWHHAAATYDSHTIELLLNHLPESSALSQGDERGRLPRDLLSKNPLLSSQAIRLFTTSLSPQQCQKSCLTLDDR